jgi:hypothetical protein
MRIFNSRVFEIGCRHEYRAETGKKLPIEN